MIILRINTETDLDLKQIKHLLSNKGMLYIVTYYQESSWHKTGYILQYSLKTKRISFKAISGVYGDTLFTCKAGGFFKQFYRHTKYSHILMMSIIPYLLVLRILGGLAHPLEGPV